MNPLFDGAIRTLAPGAAQNCLKSVGSLFEYLIEVAVVRPLDHGAHEGFVPLGLRLARPRPSRRSGL
ncbi:MAG: hypothetical protein ACRD3V_17650 [Vicinamibacteria bacterium]